MESKTLMSFKHCKLCTSFTSNLHGVCGMVWYRTSRVTVNAKTVFHFCSVDSCPAVSSLSQQASDLSEMPAVPYTEPQKDGWGRRRPNTGSKEDHMGTSPHLLLNTGSKEDHMGTSPHLLLNTGSKEDHMGTSPHLLLNTGSKEDHMGTSPAQHWI